MKVVIGLEVDGLGPEILDVSQGSANPGFVVANAALEAAKALPLLNERIAAGDVTIVFLPEVRLPVDAAEAAPDPEPEPEV